jgi:diaminopimelate decarboxylase
VLKAAREANYVAECISIAEVHAALNSKFLIEQIILTGPGKFYDVVPKEATLGNASRGLPGPLRAIFADSLSDLRNIVHRVLDPNDWLDSSMIGVRWIPSWHRASRFGLDPKDPEVVLAAAEMISALPSSKEVGMHFHFASSNVGSETWFSLAHAFCQFCAGFTTLINRPLAAIDFGGGWSPHFFVEDESSNNTKLNILLQSLYINFHSIQTDLPSIQFEPGKCISEAAGGIITRILGIRELSNDSTAEDSHTCKAMIVDSCIAEVSSPHIHPIFWRPNRSDGVTDDWIPVGPGICL